jgi:hypothetical protein
VGYPVPGSLPAGNMGMGKRLTGIAIGAALFCALPAVAQAAGPYPAGQPYATWDGTSPFNCILQDAGTGTTVPDPNADPYCVEFDKTHQNVTDFGIFDFLANEPARFAAAGPKCFYYQSDHWTGSIVQDTSPETWHWDGQYFFDKALGVGGVNIQSFRIGGQPASPSAYGEVPPEFAPYMDQGGGGSYFIANEPADPTCYARVDTPAEQAQIYAHGTPPPLPPGSAGGLGGSAGSAAGVPTALVTTKCKRKKRHGHASAAKKRRCKKKRR